MPFYTRNVLGNIKLNIIESVTLQVRILNVEACGKKASPFASASMTLEATLILSLLIFATTSLMLPMKILTTERRIQAALEAVGEDLSKYAYIQDAVNRGKYNTLPGADEFAKAFCRNLSAGVGQGYALAKTLEHGDTSRIHGADILQSRILEDGETIDLILEYKISMPFPVLGLGDVTRTARCSRRAWIGKPGKGEGSGEDDGEDITVYIGKNSTRYHVNSSCHYLANTLTSVFQEQVGDRRNESGGKYHACAVCGAGAQAGTLVYILPNGNSYHRSRTCRAIMAYTQAVKLSKVKHLGACSYCGK